MKIQWAYLFAGTFIFSFFTVAVLSGAKLMQNSDDINLVLFISALMIMMLKEVYWGISLMFNPFRRPSQEKENETKKTV